VQVPGYLEQQDALKAAGIDEVLVYCVNDGAVMKAWAEDQGVEDSMITFMGDPAGAFTGGLSPSKVLDHPGPVSVLGGPRCKRFAMYVDDGVVKYEAVSEGPDDPAGDSDPSATCVEAMLEGVKSA
jgi:2-Cys peroxiredoxin 5